MLDSLDLLLLEGRGKEIKKDETRVRPLASAKVLEPGQVTRPVTRGTILSSGRQVDLV